MIFLLGRQAMLGQEPPIYFRSMTTARIPFLARVQAMYLPASPLPSTTTSYSSGCGTGVCIDLSGYLAHCEPTFSYPPLLPVMPAGFERSRRCTGLSRNLRHYRDYRQASIG